MFDSLLLTGIFVSLLAGQLARIELIDALANVYIHEFLLLTYIGISYFRYGFLPIKNIFSSKLNILFLSVLIFSYALSFGEFTLQQNGLAILYFLRLILYFLFGVYLTERLKNKKGKRVLVYHLIYSFSILLLISTAIQYIFYPNFWVLKPFGWDPHMYRASAAYFDIFVAAALYGVLAFFWFSKKKYILSFLFVVALALSFSRSAYIAFVITLIYYFVAQKKWKEIALSLVLFSILILVIPKPFGEGVNLFRTSSIHSRLLDYKLGLEMWQKKPVFGFGYNRIRFAKEQLSLIQADDRSHSLASFHSSFLVILVTTGAVGFVLFIISVILFFRSYPILRVYGVYLLTMTLFDNVLLHVLVILPVVFIGVYLNQSKPSSYSSLE